MKNSTHRHSRITAGRLAVALIACALPVASWAGNHGKFRGGHFAKARVIDSQPIVQLVQVTRPERVCWSEPVHRSRHRHHRRNKHRSHDSFVPTVVGGIVGGVVGNQFGSGRGKDAMTVAGALLGASIGRDASVRHGHRPGYRRARTHSVRRHCEVRDALYEEERLTGYRVTYRYHGRRYVTEMPNDPGRFVRVKVRVAPIS